MNDKSLVSFVTAAEKGSFYKAAQVLFTTPQTIVQSGAGSFYDATDYCATDESAGAGSRDASV